jgi:hypothetical protein
MLLFGVNLYLKGSMIEMIIEYDSFLVNNQLIEQFIGITNTAGSNSMMF